MEPLDYWLGKIEHIRYKDLAKMEIELNSKSAMSADPERLFSREVSSLLIVRFRF